MTVTAWCHNIGGYFPSSTCCRSYGGLESYRCVCCAINFWLTWDERWLSLYFLNDHAWATCEPDGSEGVKRMFSDLGALNWRNELGWMYSRAQCFGCRRRKYQGNGRKYPIRSLKKCTPLQTLYVYGGACDIYAGVWWRYLFLHLKTYYFKIINGFF